MQLHAKQSLQQPLGMPFRQQDPPEYHHYRPEKPDYLPEKRVHQGLEHAVVRHPWGGRVLFKRAGVFQLGRSFLPGASS